MIFRNKRDVEKLTESSLKETKSYAFAMLYDRLMNFL